MIGGMTSGLDAFTLGQQQRLRISARPSPAGAYLIPHGADQVCMLSSTRQMFLHSGHSGGESR